MAPGLGGNTARAIYAKTTVHSPARFNWTKGAILALIATMAWGGMFPIAHSVMTRMDAFYMTLLRYGSAALILIAALALAEGRGSLNLAGRPWLLALLGTVGFSGFSFLTFFGLQLSGRPQDISLIMALMPFLTAVFTSILHRRLPSFSTLGLMAVALAGVALVVYGGGGGSAHGSHVILGEAAAVMGAVCWVLYTMGAAAFPDFSPLRYSAITSALGAISIVVGVAALTRLGISHPPNLSSIGAELPGLAFMSLVAGLGALLAWNAGIKRLGPLDGVLFINMVPITTFAIEAASGTAVTGTEWLGAVVTISALVVNNLIQRRSSGRVASAGVEGGELTPLDLDPCTGRA